MDAIQPLFISMGAIVPIDPPEQDAPAVDKDMLTYIDCCQAEKNSLKHPLKTLILDK